MAPCNPLLSLPILSWGLLTLAWARRYLFVFCRSGFVVCLCPCLPLCALDFLLAVSSVWGLVFRQLFSGFSIKPTRRFKVPSLVVPGAGPGWGVLLSFGELPRYSSGFPSVASLAPYLISLVHSCRLPVLPLGHLIWPPTLRVRFMGCLDSPIPVLVNDVCAVGLVLPPLLASSPSPLP